MNIPGPVRGALLLAGVAVFVQGLLAQPAVPPSASETQPLELPQSPETVCTGETFHQATINSPSCSDTMYSYKDPELSCCETLADYYGTNSTRPSRNCFCYEPYWTRLQVLEEVTYIGLMTYLDFCSAANLTIAYYLDGAGPCAGLPAEEVATDAASTAAAPGRTLRQWLKDLKDEGLMALSFTLGLISAIGFVALLWPVVMDTILQILRLGRSKKAA